MWANLENKFPCKCGVLYITELAIFLCHKRNHKLLLGAQIEKKEIDRRRKGICFKCKEVTVLEKTIMGRFKKYCERCK